MTLRERVAREWAKRCGYTWKYMNYDSRTEFRESAKAIIAIIDEEREKEGKK